MISVYNKWLSMVIAIFSGQDYLFKVTIFNQVYYDRFRRFHVPYITSFLSYSRLLIFILKSLKNVVSKFIVISESAMHVLCEFIEKNTL